MMAQGTARARVCILVWPNMYGLPTSAITWPEDEGVPSQGGRGDALLRRMAPYLTRPDLTPKDRKKVRLCEKDDIPLFHLFIRSKPYIPFPATRTADPEFVSDKLGGIVESGHLVTIKCKTPNSKIYYTVDGTSPELHCQGSRVSGDFSLLSDPSISFALFQFLDPARRAVPK